MGNDGEMSGEVRRGHDITRLKKIGMKGEQGVRDPAGVGGGARESRFGSLVYILRIYMYAGHSTAAGRQHSHLISAMLLPVATAAFPTVVVVVVTYLGVIPSASRLHAPFFFCNCSICYSTKGDL